jgi:hypothetical protein
MRASLRPAAFLLFIATLTAFPAGQAAGQTADGVFIAAFSAGPGELVVQYGSEQGRATLNLTIQNGRQESCNVTVTVAENSRVMETRALSIAGNSSLNLSFPWTVRGEGIHRAVATLSGGNETAPSEMTAACEVVHSRPVLHPSPWYTIPCALLFIIVPSVAIWLLIRRMKGGEWLERKGKR